MYEEANAVKATSEELPVRAGGTDLADWAVRISVAVGRLNAAADCMYDPVLANVIKDGICDLEMVADDIVCAIELESAGKALVMPGEHVYPM